MMWLFGYAVASRARMSCTAMPWPASDSHSTRNAKTIPTESLLDALAKIKPDNKNPMDLTGLECETFASRHLDLLQSDRESADTIMMWLYGFAVAKIRQPLVRFERS